MGNITKMDLQVGQEHGLNLSVPGQGQMSDSCECGNELSCFIKCVEYFDYLRTY
jgi:hypothetical protein